MNPTKSNPLALSDLPGHLQVLVQKFILSAGLFFKNEILNHAAAAAFFFILSVTPVFFLLLFSFDRYLSSYPEVTQVFFSFLKNVHENLDKDFFVKIGLLNTRTRAIGIFGALNLLWAGGWILSAIQRGLAIVFPAKKKRKRLAMNFLSIIILIFLLLVSFIATLVNMGLGVFHTFLEGRLPMIAAMQMVLPVISAFLPLVLIFGVIFVAYRFVPAERPGTLSSALGAIWCTLAILLMHSFFSKFYGITRFSVIYGVLGSLILSVLLVHFTFVLFFFFAQYTYVSEKIDVLLLERMFFYRLQEDPKAAKRLDRFLFRHPRYIFDKYAQPVHRGQILFQEGDDVEKIYYLYAGHIGIYHRVDGESRRVSTLSAGEVFGEMAYLLDERRTASAVAETDAVLLVIQPALFEELLATDRSFTRDVITLLSSRLKKTNLTSSREA